MPRQTNGGDLAILRALFDIVVLYRKPRRIAGVPARAPAQLGQCFYQTENRFPGRQAFRHRPQRLASLHGGSFGRARKSTGDEKRETTGDPDRNTQPRQDPDENSERGLTEAPPRRDGVIRQRRRDADRVKIHSRRQRPLRSVGGIGQHRQDADRIKLHPRRRSRFLSVSSMR